MEQIFIKWIRPSIHAYLHNLADLHMLFAEHKFPVESLVQWLQRTENLKVKEIDYILPLYQLLRFAH